FVAGSYAKPTRAAVRPAAPPTTRISCPSQTALAPPRRAGGGAIRRHEFVAGLSAAARASRAGHGLPVSGFRPETKRTSSWPVQAPSGPWSPASGVGARARHRFVAGL